MLDDKTYNYLAHSRVFLERAKEAIAKFKQAHDAQELFVATLMLRFGIEARLFEYIEAELPMVGRREQLTRISEYQASKLLAKLTRMNPNAKDEVMLVVTPTGGGPSSAFRYAPVTDSLASIHGRLGELLHINFFRKNPYWYLAERLGSRGLPTLLHAQDLIEQGIRELADATSGTLLSHPQFHAAVQDLIDEINTAEAADEKPPAAAE